MSTGIVSLVLAQVNPGTPFDRLEALLRPLQPDVVALPEYMTAGPDERGQAETATHMARDMASLSALSAALDCVLLGGTVVETVDGGYLNIAPCFEKGRLRGTHRKVHPTDRERKAGVLPGNEFKSLTLSGLRIATLICADVLAGDSFDRAAMERPDLVFVPATSPLRPGEGLHEKLARDRDIFLEGARRSGAVVAKTCAAGTLYGRPLQGRSLVAAPWGEVLARVPPDEEDREVVLQADLDRGALAAWRRRTAADGRP